MRIFVQLAFLLFIATISCSQESHFVKTQHGKLHYEIIGEGKPILIINGGPGFSSEGFKAIANGIASLGYSAILYDQRGTGKSDLDKRDSTTVTLDQMALDIELIRKDMGIEQWIMFGHSFGGMMANYYTAKFPDKVKAIIHSSSGGLDLYLMEGARESLYNRLTNQEIDSLEFWRSALRNDATVFNRKKYNSFLASAYLYDKTHLPTVSDRLMQGDMELNRMVWADMFRINFDCKDELTSFDNPVLIIQGKQDIILDSLAYIANTVFSNSSLHFLDQCGHYGWLDQKEAYLGLIKNFLLDIEREEVETVLHNYVQSIYEQDSSLVYDITDSTLQKSGHYWSNKKQEWNYYTMDFEELVQTANSYNEKKWIPAWAPREIIIFEVKEKVATAKVKAIWGFDYMLLSKSRDGKWTIDKVLWQSYSEKEAEHYFNQLKDAAKSENN